MKKVLLISCCVIAVALVNAGIWATKAVKPSQMDQVARPFGIDSAAYLSEEDMSKQAGLIATGQCVSTQSVWVDRALVTLATIAVDEVVKGQSVSTVTVVLPGGVDANRDVPVAMTYPGAPQIRPQEEVFLFLQQDEDFAGGYTITGYAQGKYTIATDRQGQKMVTRNISNLELHGANGITRGTQTITPLLKFKEMVKSHLQ